MSKFKNKGVLIFIIALIVLYSIIYIIPKVTGALVSSYTVGYGELKIADEVNGYFVRNEKVYVAETGGKANRYVKNGTLVRIGTTVMEVTGGADGEMGEQYIEPLKRLGEDKVTTNTFSVQSGGIISYSFDGYESKLTPKTMKDGSLAFYEKLSQENVIDLKRENVISGEPVFKVVDRTKWYIVCFIDKAHIKRYESGDKINVELKDDTITCTVDQIDKVDGKGRVILSTDQYLEQFAETRVAKVSLVTSSVKGLIIENDSIAEEKGVKGVYVQDKTGEYVFVPILVLATDGKQSVIEDTYFYDEDGEQQLTVEIYDELLKDPKK